VGPPCDYQKKKEKKKKDKSLRKTGVGEREEDRSGS